MQHMNRENEVSKWVSQKPNQTTSWKTEFLSSISCNFSEDRIEDLDMKIVIINKLDILK